MAFLKTCNKKMIGTHLSMGICLFILAGCAQERIRVMHAHEAAACKRVCHEQFKTCYPACQNNCKNCTFSGNVHASERFKRYKHEQCVQGLMIARELQSYRDPLKCRKTTCNCFSDYQVCVQSCTGIIHKRLKVAPLCC